MFRAVFLFELRYWLRSWMLYVFLCILGLMIFGAASSDQIRVGGALENTYRNAPFVILNYYAVVSLLSIMMTTAFVSSAATRDFAHHTQQLVFTTRVSKAAYFFGRFWGAALVAVIPLLGTSLGMIGARFMPWNDPARWRDTHWQAHFDGITAFALPNTLFCAALIFAVAAWSRSAATSYLAGLLLLAAYAVAGILVDDLENELAGAWLDPFGGGTFELLTKYWTVADKNTLSLGLGSGLLLGNRLLWLAVGGAVLLIAYRRFRLEERFARPRPRAGEDEAPATALSRHPVAAPSFGRQAEWTMVRSQFAVEFRALVKSAAFLIILAGALLNSVPSLLLGATEGYGVSSFPVTYRLIDIIRGSLYLFTVALVTFYAGVLVWRERDARCDEIHDALPAPAWAVYCAKLAALLSALFLIQCLLIALSIGVQTWHGYTRYQPGLYAAELLFWDFLAFCCLAVLAFFFHAVMPNQYVGYFAFLTVLIANFFGWRALDVQTHLVRFASSPRVVYSDFYGYAPFLSGLSWFTAYWTSFSVLLALATALLWPRGKETGWKWRLRQARLSFPALRAPVTAALGLFLAVGAWAFVNTKVWNRVEGDKERKERAAAYEKTYKKYAGLPQPRVQSLKYWIDLTPEGRAAELKGEAVLENKSGAPLAEVHVTLPEDFEAGLTLPRARVKLDDSRLRYRIYGISPPLAPGERVTAAFTSRYRARGFENEVTVPQIVQNGTFFNNGVSAALGYQADRELSEPNDRRKFGLPEKDLLPPLERDCRARCMETYITPHSDWVGVETILSSSPDQIAVAPGSLLREWRENGRRYFHYQLDQDSLNFYSFISARYQVAREDWNGVQLEVYYHPEHHWNVPKMLRAMRASLTYFQREFGPYRHRQARIIEFPRVARFAQAFPGTMPYSESIGFIANLKDPEDIDMVFYVVAHEMAHQWWAHQVIGARMQGATLLSESLAQYSALMVMEREFGRDQMRKFLRYEMDRYLRGRGRELLKERPLLTVEADQGYIHYQKASVIMYYLREMIGEQAVNRALRGLIERFAYAPPPYPTSYELADRLRAETPAEWHGLLRDLFEEITLFSLRTLQASAVRRPDGRYDVTIETEARKFKADAAGQEREVAVGDWIEVGAFAAPPQGRKYGKTLHRERMYVTRKDNRFTFPVDEAPDRAGIDPFSLLIDRVPDDNVKKVTLPSR
jgi:ABC-type transport system involved in multi-copper enzyme maturation permease subunit